MRASAEWIIMVRRLLEPPVHESEDLPLVGEAARVPPEAAEQIALFMDRVADLSLDERQELFDETFGREPQRSRDRECLVQWLVTGGRVPPAEFQPRVERLGAALMRDGNPYHHLIAAARVLLDRP